jgi:apolipoprotein D and lipocalin family protein
LVSELRNLTSVEFSVGLAVPDQEKRSTRSFGEVFMSWMSRIASQTAVLSSFFMGAVFADTRGLKTVAFVDLKRYMGDWYVIANIPNWVEKGCSHSIESYALREDGEIDNWFVCQKPDGSELRLTSLCTVENSQTNAQWSVRFNLNTFLGKFLLPVRFGYLILDLDAENYSYTVVGHPSRNLLWIMSREKTLDEKVYQEILLRLKDQGYDLQRIVRVVQ